MATAYTDHIEALIQYLRARQALLIEQGATSGGGSSALAGLSDVDMTSTLPVEDRALIYTGELWAPGVPAPPDETITVGVTTGGSVSGSSYGARGTTLTVQRRMRLTEVGFRSVDPATYTLLVDGVVVAEQTATTASTVLTFTGFDVPLEAGEHTLEFIPSVNTRTYLVSGGTERYTGVSYDFTAAGITGVSPGYTLPLTFTLVVPAEPLRVLGDALDVRLPSLPVHGSGLVWNAITKTWESGYPAPPLQDTGWRRVAPEAGYSGDVYLRRLGAQVYWHANPVTPTAAGTKQIAILPTGFRVKSYGTLPVPVGFVGTISGTHMGPARVTSGTYLSLYNLEGGSSYYGALSWPTSDAWPSTTPGTPA